MIFHMNQTLNKKNKKRVLNPFSRLQPNIKKTSQFFRKRYFYFLFFKTNGMFTYKLQ